MASHTALATTDPHASQVAALEGRLSDLVKDLDTATTTPTSLPVGSHRWNASTERKEKWNGTSWVRRSASWDLSTSGLIFTGTGKRIQGDFSNAAHASRLALVTTVPNGVTSVPIAPNGESHTASITMFSDATLANCSVAQLTVVGEAGDSRIASGIVGTGSYLPLTFYTGGAERARIETDGRFSYKNFTRFAARAAVNQTSGGVGTAIEFPTLDSYSVPQPFLGTIFTAQRTGLHTFNISVRVVNTDSSSRSFGCKLTSTSLAAIVDHLRTIRAFETDQVSMSTDVYLTAGEAVQVVTTVALGVLQIQAAGTFLSGSYKGD